MKKASQVISLLTALILTLTLATPMTGYTEEPPSTISSSISDFPLVLNMSLVSDASTIFNKTNISASSTIQMSVLNDEELAKIHLGGAETVRRSWTNLNVTGYECMTFRIVTGTKSIGIVSELLGNSTGSYSCGVLATKYKLLGLDGSITAMGGSGISRTIPANFNGWMLIDITTASWQGGTPYVRHKDNGAVMYNPTPGYEAYSINPSNLAFSGFTLTPESAGADVYIGDIRLTDSLLGTGAMNAYSIYNFNDLTSYSVQTQAGNNISTNLVSDGDGGKAVQYTFSGGYGVYANFGGMDASGWGDNGCKGFAFKVQTGASPVPLRLRLAGTDAATGALTFFTADVSNLKLYSADGTLQTGCYNKSYDYDCYITIPAYFTGYYVMEFGTIYVESGALTPNQSTSPYDPWWAVPYTAYEITDITHWDICTSAAAGSTLVIDDIGYLSSYAGTYKPLLDRELEYYNTTALDMSEQASASTIFNRSNISAASTIQFSTVNGEKFAKLTLGAAENVRRSWDNLNITGAECMTIRIKTGNKSVGIVSELLGNSYGSPECGVLANKYKLMKLSDGSITPIGGSGFSRTIPANFDGWMFIDLTTGVWQGGSVFNRNKDSGAVMYNPTPGYTQYGINPSDLAYSGFGLTPESAGAELYIGDIMLTHGLMSSGSMNAYTVYDFNDISSYPITEYQGNSITTSVISDGDGGKAVQYTFAGGSGIYANLGGMSSSGWFKNGAKGFAFKVQTGAYPVPLRIDFLAAEKDTGFLAFACADVESLKLYNLDGTLQTGCYVANSGYDCSITIPAYFTGYYVLEFRTLYIGDGALTPSPATSTYNPWWAVPYSDYNLTGLYRWNMYTTAAAGATLIIDDLSYLTEYSGVYSTPIPPLSTSQYQIYVDAVNGNDANAGTLSAPVQTIAKAKEIVRANNTGMQKDINVFLRAGTYTLSSTLDFTTRDSGKNGYNVIWQAYKNEKVTISGGSKITGWQLYDASKNIWSAPANNVTSRDFFVNGTRADRARMSGNLSSVALTSSGFTASATGLPSSFARPQDLEIAVSALWQFSRVPVTSATKSGSTYTVSSSTSTWNLLKVTSGGFQLQASHIKYLENAYEFLDTAGEWYLNTATNTIYYIPRAGQTMSTSSSYLGKLEHLITLSGTEDHFVDNISFKGLNFSHTTWLQADEPEGLCTIQANVYKSANMTEATKGDEVNVLTPSAAIYGTFLNNVNFEYDNFVLLGNAGIHLGTATKNSSISNNYLYDCAGSGIMLGSFYSYDHHPVSKTPTNAELIRGLFWITENNDVDNNYINNVCTQYRGGIGIHIGYAAKTSADYNKLTNLPYSGISFGWGWGWSGYEVKDAFYLDANGKCLQKDNSICNNYIYSVMNVMFDGGSIYTLGRMDGMQIKDNYLAYLNNDYGSIYLDNGSQGFTVTNNALYQSYRNYIYKGDYHTITNNYAQSSTSGQADIRALEPAVPGVTHVTFSNNYLWNTASVNAIMSASGTRGNVGAAK